MLAPGKRLGPYEIVARIGAGGMGEVFKARDTRLDRSVAIKVLPPEFAGNPQVRLRFEREAKTISQLAHPHICTLYDVGSENGVDYLVMEYLEGQTLAERLERGPLPLDQVLRYGIEIADALERAHKAGIVHRDLKPGNIMLTRGGAKLLDFGLATAQSAGGSGQGAGGSGQGAGGLGDPVSQGATTEKKPLIQDAAVAGTLQYMAPEQLEGRNVDARTDIFALGTVLYEMVTGRRAFPAESKASLIASILKTQPPSITENQTDAPPALDRIIRTCLQKDPDERFQSAHDARLALQWIGDAAPVETPSTRRTAPVAIAALLFAILAIVAGLLFFRERFRRKEAAIVRSSIVPPGSMVVASSAPPELSPDGTKLVFGPSPVTEPVAQQLWIRALDSTAARPLAGTENGTYPFWSPDGKQIAFFADGKLKKIDIAGGPATVICDAPSARGGTWSGDTILFAGRYTPIMRVPASGGTPAAVTRLAKDAEVSHRWPRFLPDGEHFLFVTSTGSENVRNRIAVSNVTGTVQRAIAQATSQPLYYDGFLLTVREGALIAQRFDTEAFELRGEPIVLGEREISTSAVLTRSQFTISASGILVYQTAVRNETQLVWYDRTGAELSVTGAPQSFWGVSLSPDGKAIAAGTVAANSVWIYDTTRGVRTRLTAGNNDMWAIWSRDGRSVAFSSRRPGNLDIYIRDVGTGAERPAAVSGVDKIATSWSPDGTMIFYDALGLPSGTDIRYVTLADGKSHDYAATQFLESSGTMSPDGKWVAFQSNESGQPEVYVAPFPPTGAKWAVSHSGGIAPRWRRDGRELFFIQPSDQHVMAVPVGPGATPQIGKPVPLFRIPTSPGSDSWDVSADGQRIIAAAHRGPEPPREPMTLVQNFDIALREAK